MRSRNRNNFQQGSRFFSSFDNNKDSSESNNNKDSSESSSNEDDQWSSNAENIFQKYGNMGDWWKERAVQPFLVKIAERVNRTPSLQQEWKKKDIVLNAENYFNFCKAGNVHDYGCMGAQMGRLQKHISQLQTVDQNQNDSQNDNY